MVGLQMNVVFEEATKCMETLSWPVMLQMLFVGDFLCIKKQKLGDRIYQQPQRASGNRYIYQCRLLALDG